MPVVLKHVGKTFQGNKLSWAEEELANDNIQVQPTTTDPDSNAYRTITRKGIP
jgi:hypothetical protein